MTRLSETFEGGSQGATVTTSTSIFTSVTGAAPCIFDSASKVLGSFGMKITNSANFAYREYVWGSNQTQQYFRFYYQVVSNPASGQSIIASVLSGSSTYRAQLTHASTGRFNLRSPAALLASGSTDYTGQWVGLEWDVVAGAQQLRIYNQTNLFGTTPNETLNAAVTVNTGFDRLRLGNQAAATYTEAFDGLEIDSVSAPGMAAAPSVDATFVWDGSTLVATDPFLWNGTTLEPLDAYYWDGTTLT